MVAPVNDTTDWPIVALTVPPQVVVAFPATNVPAGNVSVNAEVSLAAVLFGLLKVKVSVEWPPARIEGAL